MLVLLPPSEGKATPSRRGRAVRLDRLSFPELSAARTVVVDHLVAASGHPDALARLGVGASLEAEVAANVRLWSTPALPVSRVYTGVLYDALQLDALPEPARRRAAREVLVSSALWGALRPGDRVPPYRLSVTADLPDLGGLAAWWRPRLEPVLDAVAGRSVIVDCRSSGYAAMWTPKGQQAARWVAVRVLREGPQGRTVVSHVAKLTRGQVARQLLLAPTRPRTPQQVADVVSEAFDVELTQPPRTGRPWVLDVVVTEG